jgi:hypothetical protein
VSTALTHALFVLVPLGLTAVLAALIWRGRGPHPATYQMSESWTHAPILWASDEPAAHGHTSTGRSLVADTAEHASEGHGTHPVTIGGGASGKW